MSTEEKAMVGALYKVACLLLFAIGVVITFPVLVFLLLWPAWSQFVAIALSIGSIVALVNSASQFKSTARLSFVAPTALGAAGAVLAYLYLDRLQSGY
jgi:hypothetical protein